MSKLNEIESEKIREELTNIYLAIKLRKEEDVNKSLNNIVHYLFISIGRKFIKEINTKRKIKFNEYTNIRHNKLHKRYHRYNINIKSRRNIIKI